MKRFIMCVIVGLCGALPVAAKEAVVKEKVVITYFGLNCFSIADARGKTVLTDPFDPAVVHCSTITAAPQIVIISYPQNKRPAGAFIKAPFQTVQSVGNFRVTGVQIGGWALKSGKKYYRWAMNGVNFLYLGACDLQAVAQKKWEGVDVVFFPVGNIPAEQFAEAWALINAMNPKILIPMCYNIPGLDPATAPGELEPFFAEKKDMVERIVERSVSFAKEDLPAEMRILVLPHMPAAVPQEAGEENNIIEGEKK